MKLKSHLAHAKQLYTDIDRNVITTLYKKDKLSGSGNHNHDFEQDFPFDTELNALYFSTFDGGPKNWVLGLADLRDVKEVKVVIDFSRYFFLLSSPPLNHVFSVPSNERAYASRNEIVLALRNEYFYLYSVIHPDGKLRKAYLNLFMINPYLKQGGYGKALFSWYENYLRTTFNIDYIYLVPLKRRGVDDAYTYWKNVAGFDYVKEADLMKQLNPLKDGDADRKSKATKQYLDPVTRNMPPARFFPLTKTMAVVMDPERKRDNYNFDRQHKVQIPGETGSWYSTSMWKKITDPQPYVPHSNDKFTAYLQAVPPLGTISNLDFSYTVDTKSQTYMKRVEGWPNTNDEYILYREKLECLSMPILAFKLNESRGFKDQVLQDSTADCDRIFTDPNAPKDVQDDELKGLFDKFIKKDNPAAKTPDLDQLFNKLPASPVPPPIPEPPTLPTDFLNQPPSTGPQQDDNFLNMDNNALREAIRAQADRDRPRLRPRVRPRQEPELIDLTLDEEVNEPPAQRRRVEAATKADATAATVARNNEILYGSYGVPTGPSQTPFLDSLTIQAGDVMSPERVALREAIFNMRKIYERLPRAQQLSSFDEYIKQNVATFKAMQEAAMARNALERHRTSRRP